ncbi:MAG: recombinase family protein [Oscillospiraceae bacterium]
MKNQLRAAAYCRVSTDKFDQANSLTSQIKYFTDYIANHEGWRMCEVYYDEGISGTSVKKRAGFNRMISDAMNGDIDLILTKEVSRFARNTVDTLSYTRKLKEKGVGVFFMNDNIDTRDSDGELRLSIMASIAQEESRKTSERVKWGQKRRMEQGVVFGRDLLGYFVRGGKLIINQDEVETVKLIFHKFLIEEKGTHVIARELYEAGIRPKRVKRWSNTVILRVLRNEKYVGDLCQKKTCTPDYLSHSKKYNRDNEEMVYLKDHHKAIIERDIWEKTQIELVRRAPSDEQKSKHSNRYWCSGRLICGECGQRFVSRTKKLKSGEIYRAWRCYSSAVHGQVKEDASGDSIGCGNSSINAKVLIAAVAFSLKIVKTSSENIKENMLKEIKSILNSGYEADTAFFHEQIKALNQKKRRAIDLLLDGTISREELKNQTEYYNEEIEEITRKISHATNINAAQRHQIRNIHAYVDEINRMMNYEKEDEAMYRSVLDKIVIYKGKVLVVYLNAVGFGIKLCYSVKGKGKSYRFKFDYLGNQAEEAIL